jgi:acyl carrier protein
MNSIEQQLLEIVKLHFNKKKLPKLHLDLTFRKDLGLDSLSLTELILACEEKFEVEIDVEHPLTAQAKTLRDLYNALEMLIGHFESSK